MCSIDLASTSRKTAEIILVKLTFRLRSTTSNSTQKTNNISLLYHVKELSVHLIVHMHNSVAHHCFMSQLYYSQNFGFKWKLLMTGGIVDNYEWYVSDSLFQEIIYSVK